LTARRRRTVDRARVTRTLSLALGYILSLSKDCQRVAEEAGGVGEWETRGQEPGADDPVCGL